MSLVALPSARIVPLPELFWHPSTLHGQAHVTRVMVHAIRLVEATGRIEHGRRLWAAVFLHDLARRHDGECHRHGADAAQRLREEPALRQRLAEAGLTECDYAAIEAAVTAHSAPKEVSRDHPHWPLIALLKDADGLDRVRLGDLDPRRLRHPEAKQMVGFAQALFDATDGVVATGDTHFEKVWDVAGGLDDRRKPEASSPKPQALKPRASSRISSVIGLWSPTYASDAAPLTSTTKQAEVVREVLALDLPIAWQAPPASGPSTLDAVARLHDHRYVQAVWSGEPRELAESQGFRWSRAFAQSVFDIWEGQTAACRLAADGAPIVIHPVSGAHHAGPAHGAGFCTFNWLVGVVPALRDDADVMVLDFDTHYGDGTVACLQACAWANRLRIVDIFGSWRVDQNGEPGYDEQVTPNGVFLGVGHADDYRLALGRAEQEVASWAAETRGRGRRPIVVYQAGVDPYEDDHVGGVDGVTAAFLSERDARVFAWVRDLRLPTVVVLAGGYSADCVRLHVNTLRLAVIA